MVKAGDSPFKKEKLAVIKRPTKKKPKDKPKRPLSAYNFFFKEEREKILKIVVAEDPSKLQTDPEADDYLGEAAIGRLKKEGGKVSFEEMGKIIGQRWKNIDPDRLSKFSEKASEDTERYKKEMQAYNGRQEAKMRSEALKPPISYASPSGVPPGPPRGVPDGYGPGPDMMGRAPVGGYAEQMANMSAFANHPGAGGGYGPYGGMEFMGGGYGPPMGMGGYPMGYGGYSMGAQGPPPPMAGDYGRGGGGYGEMGMMQGGFQGGMMSYPEYTGYEQGPPGGHPGGHQGNHPGGPPPPPPPQYGGGYGGGYQG